jgi:hypothetical protein
MHYRFTIPTLAILLAGAGLASPQPATFPGPRPGLDVLVDGRRLPTHAARGTQYIEALKGREYEIRLRNPYPVRVAVALSVDGLNTIDARHTTAAEARKWVIEPYGAITISGWQTSLTHARRFEFTSEERSYGRWLGKTDDLGIISAVFYRERVAERVVSIERERAQPPEAPAPAGQSEAKAAGADEYAATGLGRRTDHAVHQVFLDLEPTPAASLSVRYEYRAQLVRLGVLPPHTDGPDQLDRRERARGFDGAFCPEPRRDW